MVRTGTWLTVALALLGRQATGQARVDERWPLDPGGSVRIVSPFGRIRVLGWDADSLAVSGRLDAGAGRFYATGDAGARKLGVDIAADARNSGRAELQIRVPRRAMAGGGHGRGGGQIGGGGGGTQPRGGGGGGGGGWSSRARAGTSWCGCRHKQSWTSTWSPSRARSTTRSARARSSRRPGREAQGRSCGSRPALVGRRSQYEASKELSYWDPDEPHCPPRVRARRLFRTHAWWTATAWSDRDARPAARRERAQQSAVPDGPDRGCATLHRRAGGAHQDRASRTTSGAAVSRPRGPRRLGRRGGPAGLGVPPELRQQRLFLRRLHPLEQRARYVVHIDRALQRQRRSGQRGQRLPHADSPHRATVYESQRRARDVP